MRTLGNPLRRIVRDTVITLGVVTTSAAVPAAVHAATYYVATDGDDGNGCRAAQSKSTPKATINSGLTCIVAGDRLYLRGGTYSERIDSNAQPIPSGQSWSAAVTIAAYPGERVIVQATDTPGVVNLTDGNIQYLIFDGLIFDGGHIGSFGTSVISLWGGVHHVRFINAEIRNSASQGVTIFWGNGRSSEYNEFINCRVHHNGNTEDLDHGFYISGGNNLIEGCDIHDNKAWGVHVYGEGAPADNNIVRNNRLYRNGITGRNGGGVLASSGASTYVYNNLIYRNNDGIVLCCGGSDQQILNNTIFRNRRYGIEVQSGDGHAVINNILRGNMEKNRMFHVSVTESNTVTADALFVDASVNDFRLQSGSPAIDAGVILEAVPTDFADVKRPQGNSHDVGAMEYAPEQQRGTRTVASRPR